MNLMKNVWYVRVCAKFEIISQCPLHAQAVKEKPSVKPFDEVPGPKPIPVLDNIWRYFPVIGEYSYRNLLMTYEKMYHKYGPLVKEKILGDNVIVHVFDPQDMVRVYAECGENPMRRSHGALARYRRDRPHMYKNTGLFPSNGEEWYRFRRLFQKDLLHPNTAKAYCDVLEEITDDLVTRIHHVKDYNNEVNFLPELFRWAVENIGAITLNRRLGCLAPEDNEDVLKLVKSAHDTHEAVYVTETYQLKSIHTPIYKRLVAAQDYLASTVDKYMKEAMSNPDKLKENYLLSRMVSNTEADYKEIFTMLSDMFLAGIDSTAYTTGFALYNLSKYPDIQEKLRKELIQNMPEKTSKLEGKLDNLTYLQCVIKESLRMNPVAVGNGRILLRDTVLSNYEVPANTNVILQHHVASLQEKNYPQAKVFIPERWLDSYPKSNLPHPVTSVAFGFGSRTCVGKRFAQREMLLAIGKLVRNFKIEYHHEDIGVTTRLINVPDKPFLFKFIPLES